MGRRFELFKMRHAAEATHQRALALSDSNIARAETDLKEVETWLTEAQATPIADNEKWALAVLENLVEGSKRTLADLHEQRKEYLSKISRLDAKPSRISRRAKRLAGFGQV